jgi:hypothetical protein
MSYLRVFKNCSRTKKPGAHPSPLVQTQPISPIDNRLRASGRCKQQTEKKYEKVKSTKHLALSTCHQSQNTSKATAHTMHS